MIDFIRKETLEHFFGQAESLKREYCATVINDWNTELWTYPIDLVKTRLQMRGDKYEPTNSIKKLRLHNNGFLSTGYDILKLEGTLGLWKGLPPKLIMLTTSAAAKIIIWPDTKERIKHVAPKFEKIQTMQEIFQTDKYNFLYRLLSGSLITCINSPLEMAQIQLHMENRRRIGGLQPRTFNFAHSLYVAHLKGGFRGMYKGCIPYTIKQTMLSFNEDYLQKVLTHGMMNALTIPMSISNGLAGVISLSFTSIFCLPLDVVTTRILHQGSFGIKDKVPYKNSFECFRKIYKNEGKFAFYKGFVPFFLRSGFRTAFYEITYRLFVLVLGYEF